MPRATQLTVISENKPGQLAKLTAALKKAKVNILAITVVDSTDVGVIRLVVDSAGKGAAALKKAGMPPTRQEVLVATLPNEPGALQEAAAKLAAKGVNINYVYGSVAKGATDGMTVMGVDKLDVALRAL